MNKTDSEVNYVITGINANNYIIIAAYESSGGAGAPCMVGRINDNIIVSLYNANGTPYTGTATIDVYYVDAQ